METSPRPKTKLTPEYVDQIAQQLMAKRAAATRKKHSIYDVVQPTPLQMQRKYGFTQDIRELPPPYQGPVVQRHRPLLRMCRIISHVL